MNILFCSRLLSLRWGRVGCYTALRLDLLCILQGHIGHASQLVKTLPFVAISYPEIAHQSFADYKLAKNLSVITGVSKDSLSKPCRLITHKKPAGCSWRVSVDSQPLRTKTCRLITSPKCASRCPIFESSFYHPDG